MDLVFTIANIALIKSANHVCWMGGLFTKAQYLQEVNFEAAEVNQGTDRYHYPEIEEYIKKIDQKLEKGYSFSGIQPEKWENTYKQEIMGLTRSEYEISDANQQKILKLLNRIDTNMVNKREKEVEFQTDVNVEAMSRMADMDFVDNSDFPVTK